MPINFIVNENNKLIIFSNFYKTTNKKLYYPIELYAHLTNWYPLELYNNFIPQYFVAAGKNEDVLLPFIPDNIENLNQDKISGEIIISCHTHELDNKNNNIIRKKCIAEKSIFYVVDENIN